MHAVAESRIGQRVGDYVLERMLGRGGMSVVYFARELRTGRPAAIKILQADLPENISADRRLEQESRAIARIDHPNVVRVYDFGMTPDGLPYLAMEYLEGLLLSEVMASARPLPIGRTLKIVDQMLQALHAAHRLDIIHRDIKPDNVLLLRQDGADEQVKMLDFGIAKLRGPQPHSLVMTVRGVILGTPEYLPPEIAMDLEVSPATDLYAVGVILFEALTGRLPFQGRGAGELAEHHCFTPPPRPRAFNRAIPPELEQVILRCLAKDPRQRHASALELAAALRPFLEEDGLELVRTRIGVPVGIEPAPEPTEERPRTLDLVERALRDEAARRWRDAPLPPPLERSLARLDELRERLVEVETELALAEDRLGEIIDEIEGSSGDVRALIEEEERLGAEIERLRIEERRRTSGLVEMDGPSEQLMSSLIGGASAPTAVLQGVLSPENIARLTAHLRGHDDLERREEERRELLTEIERLVEARAEVMLRRARLEAEVSVRRAERGVERLRLQARCDALHAEADRLRRRLPGALSQCALDLAVAVGLR